MSSERVAPGTGAASFSLPRMPSVGAVAAALAVSAVYLLGMRIGSALTATGSPISTLWPPNALLMAVLLLSPRRLWPIFLAVLFPVHVLYQRALGVPLDASLGWFVGNTGEALIGAALLRRFETDQLFGSLRSVLRFVLFCVVLAPIVTSFWDAAVVVSTGLGSDYWRLFSVRLLSNVVAILLFVPPVVTGFQGGVRRLWRSSSRRRLEAGALAIAALAVCFILDSGPMSSNALFLEVYVPLPIFLWAALRFGPWEATTAILGVALLEVWGLIHGRGPFASGSAANDVLMLQTYSVLIAIPVLLSAVTMEERRRAVRNLRRNEERLELAFAVSRMATWEWDLRSGEVIFSESKLGFRPVPRDGDLPFLIGIVHPEDRAEVRRVQDEAIRSRSSFETECRVFSADGEMHWIVLRGRVVADPTGHPIRAFGVVQDITERKKSDEALAEAEKIGGLARSATKIAIWSLDVETGEVIADRVLPSLLGLDVGERSSSSFWLNRIYEPDRVGVQAARDYVFDASSSHDERGDIPIPEREYRIHHADGSLRWFLTRATVMRNADGSPRRIVGTAIDVTERRKADLESLEQRRQLTHLARVSALGELSGAVAHELNQPLTSILSNAQAARRLIDHEPADLPEIGKILDDIASEDRRAGEVIRHLRRLLRRGVGEPQRVDVNRVVEEILVLMRGDLLMRHVTVTTFLAPGLPAVEVEPVQLQQVLLNLILNACDAMNENRSNDRTMTVSTFQDSSNVVVAVADVGAGIIPSRMDELFRPFFTTKDDGVGLGLAISQSIVKAAGGRIWAENNLDRGATFRMALPSARNGA